MTNLAKEAAKSWSSTLRLPSSTFPPRPAPADLATYLKRCTNDLYAWQATSRPASKHFTLHDGPPYANGDLHVGHALNKILKDIICRTKLAEGYRVNYTPGWDCHGLPIEIKALEKLGWKPDQGRNAVEIRQAARAFAQETVHKQMTGFKSWGIMGDWANHWKTMDKGYELRQLSIFRAMAQDGLIYRKHKPVYWSPSSRTALAEAELEYKEDHISTAALVKFPLKGSITDRCSEPVFAAIWTTTPWTLPANQAIAISKDISYCVALSPTHGLVLLARARLSYVEGLVGESFKIVEEEVSSHEITLCTYNSPHSFDPSDTGRPIYQADFVTDDSGTGLVHCAPGHGMEDYDALQNFIRDGSVTVKAPVDDSGHFTAEAASGKPGSLAGKDVFGEGNRAVLELLRSENLIMATHQYKHKYPYDWRTKQPIMIRATAQWFADVSSIKDAALRSLDHVEFRPQTGESRLRSFVANRNEWCISRQRAWGVPIPAIYHKETGDAIVSDASIAHIMKVIMDRGVDAWWSDPADDYTWIMDGLSASDYRRGSDTMDVWFDSGTSWKEMKNSDPPVGPPADIYIEGTDQHRGWFQSSLLTNIAHEMSVKRDKQPKAPFKSLMTHGFTLDGEGKKMSKSIGNVVSPDAIISGALNNVSPTASKAAKSKKQQSSLGPDALRLWAASSDWTKDVVVSETIIKTVHAALHKYRVTFKLLLGALRDFQPAHAVDFSTLALSDGIAIFQLQEVAKIVRSAYQNSEFYRAVTAINRWVNTDFSGFYMESVKDSLYCDSRADLRRRSAQTVLYNVLVQLQSMLGPVNPMLVEETWQHMPDAIKASMGHPLQREWEPLAVPAHLLSTIEEQLPVVMAINSAVKAAQEMARNAKKMGSSLESDVVLHLQSDIELMGLGIRDLELQEALVVSRLDTHYDLSEQRNTSGLPDEADWVYTQEIDLAGQGKVGFVEVRRARGRKCGRCWKYSIEPSSIEDICGRCQNVVDGLEVK